MQVRQRTTFKIAPQSSVPLEIFSQDINKILGGKVDFLRIGRKSLQDILAVFEKAHNDEYW